MVGSKFARPKLPQLPQLPKVPNLSNLQAQLPKVPQLPHLPNLHDLAHLVSSSSSSRKAATLRVTPNNWYTGEIRDWYRELHHTTMERLELRKEHEGVKHEFVVIHLEGDSIYRVDRRALGGPNTEAVLRGCESEDSIAPVSAEELSALNTSTDTVVSLDFNSFKPDVYIIIAICVAMQQNSETKLYHLYNYNCYFHARSVISIVTRQCLIDHSDALCTNAGIRWDIASQPTLSDEEIANSDWGVLRSVVRVAAVEALEKTIWPLIAAHSSTYEIEKEELQKIVSAVIEDATTNILSEFVPDALLYTLYKEVLGVANSSLWRDTLEKNLLNYKHNGKCEVVSGTIMAELLTAHRKQEGILEEIGSRVEDFLASPTSPTSLTSQPLTTSPTEAEFETHEEAPDGTHKRLSIPTPKNLSRTMAKTTQIMSRQLSLAQKKIQESSFMASGSLLNKAVEEVAKLSPTTLRKYIRKFIPAEELRIQIDNVLVEWKLKNEIVEHIINNLLLQSDGEIPESMLRIVIEKEKEPEQVRTHVALQAHVLRMTREHSKVVARVMVGLTEEGVYSGLQQKMESIWKDVQPLSVSQSWVREAYTRITAAAKESIHTVVHDCMFHLHRRVNVQS